MVKIGKGKNGVTLYMTYEEVASAKDNLASYKGKLTNQQFAKLRKAVVKND